MYKMTWIAILLALTIPVEATKKIQGTVRDAETGAVLPNASIRIYNTLSGTLADNKGYFALNLWQLPTVINITHIGYHLQRIVISESSNNEQNIQLTSRTYALQEIIVTPPHSYLRQFTFNGGKDGHWSPDGQRIAFISSREDNPEVWVKPLSGGPSVRYTHNDVWDCSPTWSPNGKHLAFVSEQGGNLNIWTMLANGDSLRPVTVDSDRVHDGQVTKHTRKAMFSWSPDGKEIAFARRGKDTGFQRFRRNPDGT